MQEIDSENAILRVHLERAEKSLDLFREEKHHSDELVIFIFFFHKRTALSDIFLACLYKNFRFTDFYILK